ncbi:FlgO family outer membrane protein [Rheinheimera maricola]|uniref:FlgO domain-containing protein n=1 Tax=Rheinheimera maricola TaxID=2793282 RepID=A0ABS7X4S7_9GAMM|nr:FlgO family outer membrane protein [Rheinheimera maricola]MBZ9610184.1 hypothetical protein [Rheinheimera maricola]
MKTILLSMTMLTLTACSTPPSASQQPKPHMSVNAERPAKERAVATPAQFQPAKFVSIMPDNSRDTVDRITIHHYIRGMMQDMLIGMQSVTEQTPVAVASFLYLDTDYNQASMLGNQIAESFMHELHNAGITVLDFKVTDYIRVTNTGDLVLSRNYEELGGNLAARFAVGGTLANHKDGILINARMVQFDSKVVVASAQSLVPRQVIDALLPSEVVNTTPLIKGR